MICLFFKFGQILKFLHLLIARSPKNPMETLATPDGRRQFQGDTHAHWPTFSQCYAEDVVSQVVCGTFYRVRRTSCHAHWHTFLWWYARGHGLTSGL